jgi:hypothetical protein
MKNNTKYMMFINAEGKIEDEEGYPPFTPLKAAEIAARMKMNR